jgi:hypothetical protein
MKKFLSLGILLSIALLTSMPKSNAATNNTTLDNNAVANNNIHNYCNVLPQCNVPPHCNISHHGAHTKHRRIQISNDEEKSLNKSYCIIENTEESLSEKYINSVKCIGYKHEDNLLEMGLSNYGTDNEVNGSQCGIAMKNQILQIDYTTVLQKGDNLETNIYDGGKNLIGTIGANKKGTMKIKFYENSQFYINTTSKNTDFYVKINQSIIDDSSDVDSNSEETLTKTEEKSTSKDYYTIGYPIKINDLTFTIDEIKTSQFNQYKEPAEDNHFLYIDLTVENKGTKQEAMTSIMMFRLSGNNDDVYNMVLPEPADESINGLLNPGDTMSGKVCFQVPKDIKEFNLEIQPSMIDKKRETVNLKI